MKSLVGALVLVALCAASVPAQQSSNRRGRARAPRVLILRGAKVLTDPASEARVQDVLVRGGRIAAVGDKVSAEGARVIDLSGHYLVPSWIDARSEAALDASTVGAAPGGPKEMAANALRLLDDSAGRALLRSGTLVSYQTVPAASGTGMTGATVSLDPRRMQARVIERQAGVEMQIGERASTRRGLPFDFRRRRFPRFALDLPMATPPQDAEEACFLAGHNHAPGEPCNHGANSHAGHNHAPGEPCNHEADAHAGHNHAPGEPCDHEEHSHAGHNHAPGEPCYASSAGDAGNEDGSGQHTPVLVGDAVDFVVLACGCLEHNAGNPPLEAFVEEVPFPTLVGTAPLAPLNRRLQRSSVTTRQASRSTIESAFSAAEKYRKAKEKYEKDLEEYEKKLEAWKKGDAEKAGEKKKPAPEKKAEPKEPRRLSREELQKMSPAERRRYIMERMRNRGRRSSSSSKPASTKGKDGRPLPPAKPYTDPTHEAVLRVVDGKAPLRIEAHWKEDIVAACELATKRKLALVLVGATEAWRALDQIEKAGAMVVLGAPIQLGQNRLDVLRARADLAAELHRRGIRFAFMTAGVPGFDGDDLSLVAQLAIAAGLPEDAALRALTTDAAAILGLGEGYGRVATGARALLQILSDAPLSPDARVVGIVAGGTYTEL